ncbi:MAG: hypothetical protein KJO07_22365, partial [Deltaproteobacteria bacterium]|nr:hypothetical protein [Deltaproteobacteria bacterium]
MRFVRRHHLAILICLLVPGLARAGTDPLQTKLDRAIDLVAKTPGFEQSAKRISGLRAKGEIKIAKLEGALAMVQSSETIYVTRKLLRSKSIKFIASTLVHEAVHLDQDDSRYYYVEEIEFKAYKMGGRFKLKVGMKPETIEKAAMRLTRNQFVREASTILTG